MGEPESQSGAPKKWFSLDAWLFVCLTALTLLVAWYSLRHDFPMWRAPIILAILGALVCLITIVMTVIRPKRIFKIIWPLLTCVNVVLAVVVTSKQVTDQKNKEISANTTIYSLTNEVYSLKTNIYGLYGTINMQTGLIMAIANSTNSTVTSETRIQLLNAVMDARKEYQNTETWMKDFDTSATIRKIQEVQKATRQKEKENAYYRTNLPLYFQSFNILKQSLNTVATELSDNLNSTVEFPPIWEASNSSMGSLTVGTNQDWKFNFSIKRGGYINELWIDGSKTRLYIRPSPSSIEAVLLVGEGMPIDCDTYETNLPLTNYTEQLTKEIHKLIGAQKAQILKKQVAHN